MLFTGILTSIPVTLFTSTSIRILCWQGWKCTNTSAIGASTHSRAPNSFKVSLTCLNVFVALNMLSSDSVHQVIQYTYAMFRNKTSVKVARASGGKHKIEKNHVIWFVTTLFWHWNILTSFVRLGTHAFHAVLSKKAVTYPSLLRHLTFELSLPRYRQSRKLFRAVVKEGLLSMVQILFWLL